MIDTILLILLFSFLFMFFTWGMYLSVMNLIENKKHLTLTTKCFAYPLALLGIIMDVLLNLTVCTLLFLELPKTWMLTDRLQSHLDDIGGPKDGWRGTLALWICSNLLDPFDARGFHCKKKNNE
jgi:hypothetical protein